MNVYDFDGTIYDGDSTLDFYFYTLEHTPKVLKAMPRQCIGALRYLFHLDKKTKFKENFYSFLKEIDDTEDIVNAFWKENEKKIKKWYLDVKKENDLVISASPEFLLVPICRKLNIMTPIASRVDWQTGKYTGKNCYGTEKVERFKELYGDIQIDNFYSDSKSDLPLAQVASNSFLVEKNIIKIWEVE